jgi:hypothetical protein
MAVGSKVGDEGEAMHRRQIIVRCISVTWLIRWGVGGAKSIMGIRNFNLRRNQVGNRENSFQHRFFYTTQIIV